MSAAWMESGLDADLWESMFYTTYTTVRTAILTPILVLTMFMALRVGGARTLTQSTLFNRTVSVAVGSLVGSSALRPNTPLTAAVIAIVVIIGSSLLVGTLYSHGLLPSEFVHARPTLLYANGQTLDKQLRHCMIHRDKLASELRSKGHSSWANIYAIVLESNGNLSIITKDKAESGLDLLEKVNGYDPNLFNRFDSEHTNQTDQDSNRRPACANAPAGTQHCRSAKGNGYHAV